MSSEKPEPKNFKVKISEEKESGVYANAVSVHFNNSECVIDLAYSIPNSETPTLKVVSRVNMSHKTAESFLKVMSNALLDWKNKTSNKDQ